MSGHNKWSTIKHKKAREDAKRGKVFTKIMREITISAHQPEAACRGRCGEVRQHARGQRHPRDPTRDR